MTTVNDILSYMETFVPQSKKQSWDNVGLLCGRKDKPVKKILIALDPFEAVVEEAIRLNADMILTHHPIIFTPCKEITSDTSIGRCIMKLIRHDIAAVNAHTNLDIAPGGVNDCLASALGLQDITVLEPEYIDEAGNEWGLLHAGTIKTQSIHSFLEGVKKALQCPGLRFATGSPVVHRVAVCGGSGGDEFMVAYRAGCDTYVTSDVKYNQFWDAKDLGMNIIDAGHFYTENPVCQYLRQKLVSQFPAVDVLISEDHKDCMKYC